MIIKFFILFLLCFSSFAHTFFSEKLIIKDSLTIFLSSHELNKTYEEVEHIIISITGSERNVDTYVDTMIGVTKKYGVDNKTLVVTPHFKINSDPTQANELVYSYEGWWIGDQASNNVNVSSFEVMDQLISYLTKKELFPNLKNIVLTGHSAGGHFVQRYALGSAIDLSAKDIKIKFVAANPGTYAYLNSKRPIMVNNNVDFQVPRLPGCAYNRYKYGLEYLNPYMIKTSVTKMISRYLDRDVTYFIGENDVGDVEQSCEARLQGSNRFQRGVNFFASLKNQFQKINHQLVTVPNVGHTQAGMYRSPENEQVVLEDIIH